ncbi:MAG: VOC family protein [Pelolinea sp.]|nr:VOC family protein [Pelolinea sp.]
MDKKLSFLENGISQIGVIVKDLDQAVENYWNVFGIGPWHFYTYEKPFVKHMTYLGKDADYSMRLALSYFGPMRIELIEIKEGNSIYRDFVNQKGYGIQHLGILVEDMQSSIREAEVMGIKVIQDGSGFGLNEDGHYAYLDTQEDYGITFELIERPKGRKDPEKVYPADAGKN